MARLGFADALLREAHREELRRKRTQRRIVRYLNNVFTMADEEFLANYHVSKSLFNDICAELKTLLPTPRRKSDIVPKYKILVALSFFATGSYQRLVGNNFETLMSQQSVSRALREVIKALNDPIILNKWIKFPQTEQERNAIKLRFCEKFKLPAVLGCVDGTHVAIMRPSQNEKRYLNKNGYHSINVMIVCDADLNILCVDATFGGASRDNIVLNQNPIKHQLIGLVKSGVDGYLLGDLGYPQREYLMIPIVNAVLGSPEDHYTKLHCTAMNTVERTIAILKNRWHCLLKQHFLHYQPEVAGQIITACCVLHNMCNKSNLMVDFEQRVDSESMQPLVNESGPDFAGPSGDLRFGILKRATLIQQLWAARHKV